MRCKSLAHQLLKDSAKNKFTSALTWPRPALSLTMTFEIALVLGILLTSLILFVSEIIRMDLVAMLVLCALAVSGLVGPNEAFAGFSNSAVITVWAMFILSEGLTRTGIANVIGFQVMRIAGAQRICHDYRNHADGRGFVRIHE